MEEIHKLLQLLYNEIKEIKTEIKEIKQHIQIIDSSLSIDSSSQYNSSPNSSPHFKNVIHLRDMNKSPRQTSPFNSTHNSNEIPSIKPHFERQTSPNENDISSQTPTSLNQSNENKQMNQINSLITPRKMKRINQQFERSYELLQYTDSDSKVDIPKQPRPHSRQQRLHEKRFDQLGKELQKSLKQCKYDSVLDGLTPSSFVSHVKELENVLIIVETLQGLFGSFHSFFLNDANENEFDEELFLFDQSCNGNIQKYHPIRTNGNEIKATFFDTDNQNVFGITNGYWLKTEGNWIIDEGFSTFFSKHTSLLNLNNGDIKRISVWCCE